MRSLSARLLLSFLVLLIGPALLAHDVTLTGTQSFASIDGSSNDHDGTINGVFTVNDGNLTVNGVVNCNDGVTGSPCPMIFTVSGNMVLNAGSALYSEDRLGTGSPASITLNVGGNLVLNGTSGSTAGAIVSAAALVSSVANGGNVTANVGGTTSIGSGATVDVGSYHGLAGNLAVNGTGAVTVNGNVYAGPSRTLSTLTGGLLFGGSGLQKGGTISIKSTTFAEPAVLIGSNAMLVAQGENSGTGNVSVDGCGIQIKGLVAALSRGNATGRVVIRSGKDLLIDSRDLGVAGATLGRTGQLRADGMLTGDAASRGVDVFTGGAITILGPPASSSSYAISSSANALSVFAQGGTVRIVALDGGLTASGRVADASATFTRGKGGTIIASSKGTANLDAAILRAIGNYSLPTPGRAGGDIIVRSHSGNIVWTNGNGDVRPIGSSSGLPSASQGSITLTACGTVNTIGTTFPTNGVPTGVFPVITTGSCSPAAPSLPAGVSPLITCNTPPVANDLTASTNEDAAITVTLSGSDVDGDPLTFTIVTPPAHGSLGPIVPTGPTTATVDYAPSLNYNGADSFVYQANDGNGGTDSATVTITIAPVNDAPSFLAGPTVNVFEDSGAQTYAAWASSISAGPSDEAGQIVTFTVSNDNPSLFSVQPSIASNGTLTFTPATNAYGSAIITVVAHDNGGTANGGVDTSASQTSTINVNAVNDEPSFVAGANQTVLEDAGAQTVAGWATAIFAGPNETQVLTFFVSSNNPSLFSAGPSVASNGTLTYAPAANANGTATVSVYLQDDGGNANGGDGTSATQTFTISVTAVNDAPSFTSGGNVTVNEDSSAYSTTWASAISAGPTDESAQTLTFSVANDNNALFSAQPSLDASGNLTFTPAANAFGSATVMVTVSDNGGTANGGVDTSAPQSFTITVSVVNDEPSFTAGGSLTVNEDSGAHSAPWATAISAGAGETQTLTFFVSNDNNALFASQPSIDSSGTLTFTPTANAFGTATVTVYLKDDGGTANGGDDTSASVTFTIDVTSVNDEPSFVSGGDVSVNEDSGGYSAAWATGISAGPANESSQSVTFFASNNNNALFSVQPSISPVGMLTFTVATNASGSATVSVYLKDDGGIANGGDDTSATQTFTITVNAVNDAPSFTGGGDVTVNEDSGAYSATWATAISAGPGEGGQTVSFFASNTNNALFSTQPSISASGVLTFTPAPNAFGSATVSVYAQDNGGTANGGVDTSATVMFTITVNGINDPPSAGNDSWETFGNTELRVDLAAGTAPHVADTTTSGSGVLDNDVDAIEGDPFVITGVVACADTSAPFVCAVTGGTVTLNANGTFSFQPSPGATSGSFQYTVTDMPSAGAPASANGTVTITFDEMIWYVNGAAAAGNGTSASPFNSFAPINTGGDPDDNDDYIFVHSSTFNSNITLEQGQRLWGEGVGLILPHNLNGNGGPTTLVAAGTRPNVSTSGDVVSVPGVNAEVAGLSLNSGTGNAIDVTSTFLSAASTVSIYGNVVTGAGAEGLDVNAGSTSGTTVLANDNTITSTGNGFDVSATLGTLAISFTNAAVTSGGTGVRIDGTAPATVKVIGLSNVTVSGSTAGDGIRVTNAQFDANAGTAAFETVNAGAIAVGSSGDPVGAQGVVLSTVSGDLAFGSLTAYATTNGVTIAGSGLFMGAAGMRVTSGGGEITANAGVGLSATNTSIGAANLSFASISAKNAANGILLNNTGNAGGLVVSGTGSAGSGGTIQNTTSDAVRLVSTANTSLSYMNLTNSATAVTNGVACHASNAGNCEAAVDMSSVSNVSLANVVIDHNNGGQAGISGLGVNGLSVTNSQILEVGDADAESAVLLQNASGTVLFQDVLIDAPEEYGVRVYQTTGIVGMTLRRVTVQNNIGTFGEAGASWRIEGGTATVLVDDSGFLNTDGPAVDGQAVLGGVLNLTLTGNVMNENRALPAGVNFITSGTSTGRLAATSNTITGCVVAANCSQGIDLDAVGTSTLEATITGNVITNTGIGTGIELIVNDNSIGRAEIRNNSISVNANRLGMSFLARALAVPGATGQLHVTAANNTINGINSAFIPGVQFAAGASTGTHATTVCANVSTLNGSGNNAVNGTPGPNVYAFTLRQRTGTTFQVQGFTGVGTIPTNVETFVQTNNSAGSLAGATEVFAAAGSTIVNYSNATCQTPSATPLP